MSDIVADEKFLKDHGIEDWGGGNTPPTPYYKSDAQSLFLWIATYGFGPTEYRQVYIGEKETKNLRAVYLMEFHLVVFMINFKYSYDSEDRWSLDVWKVGCKHDFEEISTILGDHWCTCKKCGFKYYYNSGD